MNGISKELVCLDGMWLREEQLLKLAIGVGNFALAEHYLCALLAHAVMFGDEEAIWKVNKVREHYGLKPLPEPKSYGGDEEDAEEYRQKSYELDDKARTAYRRMSVQSRKALLKGSLSRLRENYDLFRFARHWLAVFLVVRDRLEGEELTYRDFVAYADSITPEDWPAKLRCNESTAKNFSRELDAEERLEAYYDMKNNPQLQLCNVFWDIVKQAILSEK